MISVPPLIPATPRERQPRSVILQLSERISSGIPGTSFSMTAFVASGVLSLGENPLPPVVNTRAVFSSSAHLISSAEITSLSSGTMEV